MLSRLWTAFKRDNVINWRTGYVAITALVVVMYVVVVRWLIPADVSSEPRLYILDQTADRRIATFSEQQPGADVVVVDSVAALEEGMQASQNSVGLALEEGDPVPEVTYYFQSFHGERARNLMIVSTDARVQALYGAAAAPPAAVETTTLRSNVEAYRLPFNKLLVPAFLFSDPAMIGMIFMAVLIFMEKDEGTLRAYLVTPGRTWEYLLTKALTIALLAVGFTLLFVPATAGVAGVNWPVLLVLVVLGALFTSLLGAAVAVYFDNISQFLFPAILLILFISLPSAAYFVPGFSPWWLRVMPTYPLVFGLREAIFPSGNTQIILLATVYMLAAVAVALAVATFTFNRQIAQK